MAAALVARSEEAFLGSVLLISAASAVADLPLHRSGAGVLAAVGGALVLGLIETGGAVLEPSGGGTRLGRPWRAHVCWVTAVAVGGAGVGWLLLSLEPGLAGLGVVALAFGVLAAVGTVLYAGALTGLALSDDGRSAGGISPRGRRAPSRRDRRRARGTKPAPPDRPPRSTPSS
jgi:hypothetical protein